MNPQRALLVDDDPVVQMLVTHFLQGLGFEVETATTVQEALYRLEANAPHLLLLDLFLSDGQSTPLLEHLTIRTGASPVIVIMTACEDVEAIMGDSFLRPTILQKPFTQSELREHLLSIGAIEP